LAIVHLNGFLLKDFMLKLKFFCGNMPVLMKLSAREVTLANRKLRGEGEEEREVAPQT